MHLTLSMSGVERPRFGQRADLYPGMPAECTEITAAIRRYQGRLHGRAAGHARIFCRVIRAGLSLTQRLRQEPPEKRRRNARACARRRRGPRACRRASPGAFRPCRSASVGEDHIGRHAFLLRELAPLALEGGENALRRPRRALRRAALSLATVAAASSGSPRSMIVSRPQQDVLALLRQREAAMFRRSPSASAPAAKSWRKIDAPRLLAIWSLPTPKVLIASWPLPAHGVASPRRSARRPDRPAPNRWPVR